MALADAWDGNRLRVGSIGAKARPAKRAVSPANIAFGRSITDISLLSFAKHYH
jgi:hypothetical protein